MSLSIACLATYPSDLLDGSIFPSRPPLSETGANSLLTVLRSCRYPKSLVYVIIDLCEKVYLAGFIPLLAFISLMSLRNHRISAASAISSTSSSSDSGGAAHSSGAGATSGMEFLPLMATSVYCSIGLIWAYLRLGVIYLFEESEYQGQLSTIQT